MQSLKYYTKFIMAQWESKNVPKIHNIRGSCEWLGYFSVRIFIDLSYIAYITNYSVQPIIK